LKFWFVFSVLIKMCVAPRWGAGIEISLNPLQLLYYIVAPRWGAGIEIGQYSIFGGFGACRSPLGSGD